MGFLQGVNPSSLRNALVAATDEQATDMREAIGAQYAGRVIVASETLTSDATLEYDSVTFGTDQTAAAQAILDQATAGPITVIWDVAISCTGLKIRSNTAIKALPGCGAILRTASNKPLLANYNPTSGTIVDENIVIDGGIWNGNGAAANQDHDNLAEGWIVGIRMMGVRNLTLSNLSIVRTATFAAHFGNWERVTCTDISLDNFDGTYNHDGLHFGGPGRFATIRNITGRCDDDVVAIATNTAVSQSDGAGSIYGPYLLAGEISDVVIENIKVWDGSSAVRLLSTITRMDRIQIRGLSGTVDRQAVIIDSLSEANWRMGPPGWGNFGSISIEDFDVALVGSAYKQCLFWVDTSIEQLTLRNVRRNDFEFALPTLKIGANAKIQQLILDGWASIPSTRSHSANAASQITNAGQIGSWQISDSNFARPDAAAAGYPIANTGIVRQLQCSNVQGSGWAGLVSNTGTVTIDNSEGTNNDVLTPHWTLESGFATQTPYHQGRVGVMAVNAASKVGYLTTSDAFGGNVKVTADISTMASPAAPLEVKSAYVLFARGSTVSPWSGATCYAAGVDLNEGVNIYKINGGTASLKATLATAIAAPSVPMRLILVVKTSGANVVVTLYVQRVSDGYYLNPSKVFVAPTDAGTHILQWTDTTSVISGSGEVGFSVYGQGGGVNADLTDFRVEAAP